MFDLRSELGVENVISHPQRIERYSRGIRVGGGAALAVALPNTLLEYWRCLEVCVAHNKIILVQAANTGLTGGSTPDGDDYDRDVLIISTLKLDVIHLLSSGKQVVACAGATLYQLEERLEPLQREPHSVIGSSCIGASVVGGVCNNSGGNLLNRGPAYTEHAIFAQVIEDGQLQLCNHLGIDLGYYPEEILVNLQAGNFDPNACLEQTGVSSDQGYTDRLRDLDADTPSRFNADKRRLYEASGCAGKVAVFAVRLDTFVKPQVEQVFYIGTNTPEDLTRIRSKLLAESEALPDMVEYIHRDYFDGAAKYCKDTYLFIRFFGSKFLPKLFSFKSRVDSIFGQVSWLPSNLSDRVLQFLSNLWPQHIPKRIQLIRDKYRYMLMIKASDQSIPEVQQLLVDSYGQEQETGSWISCTEKEGEAIQLIRFVAGGASARYAIVNRKQVGGLMPLDVALPRNSQDWHSLLPDRIKSQLAAPYELAHFFCMVFHWDFVVKKGVDVDSLKAEILEILDGKGAKYPAEHNVGHLYKAEADLSEFYQDLDPVNHFNCGIGKTSKNKDYA